MAITVTAVLEDNTTPPRVRLDVTSTGTATTTVLLARVNEDGENVQIRTADGGPLALSLSSGNMVGLAYDYEMPYGTVVTYGTVEGGVSGGPLFIDVARPWLIHVGVPTRSVPIELRAESFDEVGEDVAQGVFSPVGRKRRVVVTDGVRKDDDGTFTVSTENLTQLAAVRGLLADAAPLLLNVPTTLDLGVDTDYISAGRVARRRLSTVGADPRRDITIPYVVIDRPAGGSQAARTWADVVAESATWAEVLANFPTWAELLAPTT